MKQAYISVILKILNLFPTVLLKTLWSKTKNIVVKIQAAALMFLKSLFWLYASQSSFGEEQYINTNTNKNNV